MRIDVREVHPLTELPVRLGSRVERVAYMGRRRIVAPVGNRTRAGIRIEGGPVGLMAVLAPLMAVQVRRSITKDLERLKSILESA